MSDEGFTKLQHDAGTRRGEGMKLLHLWLPDPRAPAFQAEVERQASLLRHAPEEAEAAAFIDAAADWLDR